MLNLQANETGGQNGGDDAMQEKILVGHKLRRFRKSIALSQTAMAEALAISPSYLNLLEHNQRPLTVGLLLRLGNSFNFDLRILPKMTRQFCLRAYLKFLPIQRLPMSRCDAVKFRI